MTYIPGTPIVRSLRVPFARRHLLIVQDRASSVSDAWRGDLFGAAPVASLAVTPLRK